MAFGFPSGHTASDRGSLPGRWCAVARCRARTAATHRRDHGRRHADISSGDLMTNDDTRATDRSGLMWLALVMLGLVGFAAALEPTDTYTTHFGDQNLPAGCILDMSRDNPNNHCFHGKVGLNNLDSPQIDVSLVVPASPTAERDLRIMRQAIESWEGGLNLLADQMGLHWLSEHLDFHVSVDTIDPTGDDGGEFTTYPLYDPEIVVIASNPAGGVGIGIDPIDFNGQILEIFGAPNADQGPCHGIANPFDMEAWEALPGYDSHHDQRGGTYVEDCDGAGGNVCFAVNGGVDPVPGSTDLFSLYDLILHEVGHCLTLGHVGDGAEGDWGVVPTTDIMAYSYDPPGLNKCVSTLNVEQLAVHLSQYIDVNGDGEVTEDDKVDPNDLTGDGLNSFQVQHPDDFYHASPSGSAWDCPQPDLGLLPGAPTDWMPAMDTSLDRQMDVSSPADGERSETGTFRVTGSVVDGVLGGAPTATTGSATDPTGDAWTPYGDVTQLDVEATTSEVIATLTVTDILPASSPSSLIAYSVSIGFRQIDTYVDIQDPGVINVYDHSMEVPLPAEWAEWNVDAGTITFRIPRSYLDGAREFAPYGVAGWTNFEQNYRFHILTDDRAPDEGLVYVNAPASDSDPVELPPNESVDAIDLLLNAFGGEEEPPADEDRDGVLDSDDECPALAGGPPSGCPTNPVERITYHVNGQFVGETDVQTPPGPAPFALDLTLPPGEHDLTVAWEKRGRILGTDTRALVVPTATGGAPGAPGADADPTNGAAQTGTPMPTTGGGATIAIGLLVLGVLLVGRRRHEPSPIV